MKECPPTAGPVFVTVKPGAKTYTMTLDRLTAHVRAARIHRAMGRLADILKPATNAKLGLETAVESHVTKYIERVQDIKRRTESVFMKKHEGLDVDMGDLSEYDQDLEDFAKNDRSNDGETSESKIGDAYVGTSPPKR